MAIREDPFRRLAVPVFAVLSDRDSLDTKEIVSELRARGHGTVRANAINKVLTQYLAALVKRAADGTWAVRQPSPPSDEDRRLEESRWLEDCSEWVIRSMLVRRVTLDSYFDAQLAELKSHTADKARPLVERRKAFMNRIAEPADEWWEWIEGTEKLMQSGGIALLRGGSIVWAHQDWIS